MSSWHKILSAVIAMGFLCLAQAPAHAATSPNNNPAYYECNLSGNSNGTQSAGALPPCAHNAGGGTNTSSTAVTSNSDDSTCGPGIYCGTRSDAPLAVAPINAHNNCYWIDNSSTQAVFVPFKSSSEWGSFLSYLPSGVTKTPCALPRYYVDGGTTHTSGDTVSVTPYSNSNCSSQTINTPNVYGRAGSPMGAWPTPALSPGFTCNGGGTTIQSLLQWTANYQSDQRYWAEKFNFSPDLTLIATDISVSPNVSGTNITITSGDQVRLDWTNSIATQPAPSGNWSGAKGAIVKPTVDTTYVLSSTSNGLTSVATVTVNVNPANCNAGTETWTVAGVNCSGPIAATLNGSSAPVTSNNGNTGTASYACNAGSFILNPGATCTAPVPASCSACPSGYVGEGGKYCFYDISSPTCLGGKCNFTYDATNPTQPSATTITTATALCHDAGYATLAGVSGFRQDNCNSCTYNSVTYSSGALQSAGSTSGCNSCGPITDVLCTNDVSLTLPTEIDAPANPLYNFDPNLRISSGAASYVNAFNICTAGGYSAPLGDSGMRNHNCNSCTYAKDSGGTMSGCNSCGPISTALCTKQSCSTGTVNGLCGSANGTTPATAPTTNLCSAGVPSSIQGSGPWSWTCLGSGGGSDSGVCSTTASTCTWQAIDGIVARYCSRSQTFAIPADGSSCLASQANQIRFSTVDATPCPLPWNAAHAIDSPGVICSCGTSVSCGSAANSSFATAPTTNLCSDGSIPAASQNGSNWEWMCGSNVCTAQVITDGVCGSDNGQTLSSAPTNLCSAGTASAVSGSGPWSWTCNGSNGGSNASCQAQRSASNTCHLGYNSGFPVAVPAGQYQGTCTSSCVSEPSTVTGFNGTYNACTCNFTTNFNWSWTSGASACASAGGTYTGSSSSGSCLLPYTGGAYSSYGVCP